MTINGPIGETNWSQSFSVGNKNPLYLSGTNTYSGSTTIGNNTLYITGSGRLGGVSGQYAGNITNSGTLNYGSSAAQTFSGAVSGTGALTMSGTGGALTLSGTNNYSGVTTITNGAVMIFQGGGALSPNTVITNFGTATLQIANDGSGNNGIINLGNNITLANAAVTPVINVGNNGTSTSNTVAFGSLSYSAPGNASASTININGANGYSVSFSSLLLNGGNGNSATLQPTNVSVTITGNVTNQQTVVTTGHYDPLILGGASTGNAINGTIFNATGATGSGFGDTRITKQGTSTWSLNGTNNCWGTNTITGGTLLINGNSSGATNAWILSNAGSTLGGVGIIGGAVTASASTVLAPGNLVQAGTLTLTNGLTVTNTYLSFILTNQNAGAYSQLFITNGAFSANGTNQIRLYPASGVISDGTYVLVTNTVNRAGAGNFVFAASGATNWNLGGATLTLTTNANSVVLNVTGGPVSYDVWSGTQSGTWDTTTANWNYGDNNYTEGDNVLFDDSATLFTVTNVSAYSSQPGSVTFNNNARAYVIGASIGGSSTVTLSGSSTVTFTGTNAYTGGTTINAGTLNLGNGGGYGDLGGSASVLLAGGNLTFNRTNPYTYNYNITSSGTTGNLLTIATNTTVTLGGSNSIYGSIKVNGNLTITGNTTSGAAADMDVGTLGTSTSLLSIQIGRAHV